MGTPARHACLCFPTSGPWPRTSRHLGDSLPAHPYVLAPTVSCPLGICPFLGQKLGDTVCTLSLLGSCECEREWGIAECKQAPWSTLDGCACPSAGSGSRLRGKQGLQRGQMFPVTARFEARIPVCLLPFCCITFSCFKPESLKSFCVLLCYHAKIEQLISC